MVQSGNSTIGHEVTTGFGFDAYLSNSLIQFLVTNSARTKFKKERTYVAIVKTDGILDITFRRVTINENLVRFL